MLKFAGSGQARSRLGEGWGGGWYGEMTVAPFAKNRATPTPNPSPQGGGECTEYAALTCFKRKRTCSKRNAMEQEPQ